MERQIETLLTHIKNDYYQYTLRGRKPEEMSQVNRDMIEEFNNSLSYKEGKKYIKVIKGGSVWGFIVNADDDKQFKKGDLLKAASWNAPARNQSRGNILDGDFSWIRWTGLEYLK